MAYAIQLTLGTSNKVSINYQSQEVSVSLTYQLERDDTDVLTVVRDKTPEVAAAHRQAWEGVRDAKIKVAPDKVIGSQTEKESTPVMCEHTTGLATPHHELSTSLLAPVLSETRDGEREEQELATSEPSTSGQQAALYALLAHLGWNHERIEGELKAHFSASHLEDLTYRQASQWLLEIQRSEREKAAQRRLYAAKLNGKPP